MAPPTKIDAPDESLMRTPGRVWTTSTSPRKCGNESTRPVFLERTFRNAYRMALELIDSDGRETNQSRSLEALVFHCSFNPQHPIPRHQTPKKKKSKNASTISSPVGENNSLKTLPTPEQPATTRGGPRVRVHVLVCVWVCVCMYVCCCGYFGCFDV